MVVRSLDSANFCDADPGKIYNLAGVRASVRAAASVALATKLLIDFSVEGPWEMKVSTATGSRLELQVK